MKIGKKLSDYCHLPNSILSTVKGELINCQRQFPMHVWYSAKVDKSICLSRTVVFAYLLSKSVML